MGVDASDIQTDFFHVDIAYMPNQGSVIDYYVVSKQVQVILKKVAKFEDLLDGMRACGPAPITWVESNSAPPNSASTATKLEPWPQKPRWRKPRD